MTEAEKRLDDKKFQADLALAYAQIAKMNATVDKMRIEGDKMRAETAKVLAENRWYPAVVASGATLAIVAIVKLFL